MTAFFPGDWKYLYMKDSISISKNAILAVHIQWGRYKSERVECKSIYVLVT